MSDQLNFETYLIISYEKFEIFLLDLHNLKNIYHDEFKFEANMEKINSDVLGKFLEKNIFKIEKLSENFVNNINVIIDNKSTFIFDVSTKNKNYSGNITNIFIENMLTDIKDLFKETYNEYKLIHMLINKYRIDGVTYTSLQDKIDSNEISLEIKLISISNTTIFEIEQILKKYQIQVKKYFYKKYLKDFFEDKQLDISVMAYKLYNGNNNNEVEIRNKNIKKQGFFEKFFQLFS